MSDSKVSPNAASAAGSSRRAERTTLIRAVAVAALASTAAYLVWRATATSHGAQLALFAPLFAGEAYGAGRLLLETWLTWTVPGSETPNPGTVTSADVVVIVADEPTQAVRSTLLGCRAITRPHRTVVVDTIGRDDIDGLATEFEVTRVATRLRTDGPGPLLAGLSAIDASLALVLRGDQVPLPDALDKTVGYFEDPRTAIVQTSIEYLNRDSILHRRDGVHERSLDNEVHSPARDHQGAALWTGSACVVRRSALASLVDDGDHLELGRVQATIRLQASGWTTRFHDDVVVQGVAPYDLPTYLAQREAWAADHLAVVRTRDNPLIRRGLTVRQRVVYLHLWAQYFQSVVDVTMVLALAVSLWTGEPVLSASATELAGLWLGPFALRSLAWVMLGRGRVGHRETAARRMLNLEIHLRAIVTGFLRRSSRIRPRTGRTVRAGDADSVRHLRLLALLALGMEVVVGARLCTAVFGWPLVTMPTLAFVATTVAAGASTWLALQVVGAFAGRRHRRSHHRMRVAVPATADGTLVKICDLSPGGVAFVSPQSIAPGSSMTVRVGLPDVAGDWTELDLRVVVRNRMPNQHANRYRVGCEFVGLTPRELNAISEYTAVVRPYELLRGPSSQVVATGPPRAA